MKTQKIKNWQEMIDHINDQYLRVRGFNYPFVGKDFSDLKNAVRIFHPWGIMALWDIYLDTADDFVRKSGYSIWCFLRQLPKLLDNSDYKVRSFIYQEKILGNKNNPILELFKLREAP